MRKAISLIFLALFALQGCATVDTTKLESKVNLLERKINVVAQRQSTLEKSIINQEPTVAYVTEVKETTTPVRKDYSAKKDISLTNKELQRALRNAGYYFGPIDGKLGPKSKKAIRDFQEDKDLKVDGIAGPVTQRFLSEYLYAAGK